LLQWGKGIGRPIGAGETVLEYGRDLAGFVMTQQSKSQDAGRIAAREIQAVSVEVNRVHYAPDGERSEARAAIDTHWRRLRDYLRLVRVR
jgi:hypothetical protein